MPKIETPESLLCPITCQLIVDPVQASDGHTYEREAISDWFQKNNTSPMRCPLPDKNLTPNLFAKRIIKEFLETNNVCTEEKFFEAIKGGNVKEFLELNYLEDYLALKNEGLTALHWAARQGYEELVKHLLREGAEIEMTDEAGDHQGNTPLIWATCRGHIATVKLLLDEGALIEHADNAGYTPLHWAGIVEVAKVLLDHQANLEAETRQGQTPLHLAAQKNREEMVKLLLERGANYHVMDANGKTPAQLVPIQNPKLAKLIPKYRQQLKIAKLKETVEQQQKEIENLNHQLKQFFPQMRQNEVLSNVQKREPSLASLISAHSAIYPSSSPNLNQKSKEKEEENYSPPLSQPCHTLVS